METLNQILESEVFTFGAYTLKVSQLASLLVILVVTKAIIWLIKKAFFC
jgi:hypothetical protein